ncbi:MAG TPA: hypothetical protein QF626_07865 [Prochlorococcaceae cyanobacterium Fu_MAG_50]|nr:hypothetical protein [Prochlorococcaceae cyanobacterium Fu_MAG_50]
MAKGSGSTLRVEPLKAAHFPMLNAGEQSARLPLFQSLLLRSWLSWTEQHLPSFLPAKQPICLVALEQAQLVGMVVIRPMNRRGSCWTLTLPEQLAPLQNFTPREVRHELLQRALEQVSHRAQSWVLNCPSSDDDQLALFRELGFQPLKTVQIWSAPVEAFNTAGKPAKTICPENPAWPKDVAWQPINRRTAPLLLPLEQAAASSHLRQILDRQWIDLLDHQQPFSGVLISQRERGSAAMAGFVSRRGALEQPVIELCRDVAWDPQLEQCLPFILARLAEDAPAAHLASASDDGHLRSLLSNQGWQPTGEELMLGRSLWRRQLHKKLLPGTRPLESMLERLQPQHPPLPTPSLGRR